MLKFKVGDTVKMARVDPELAVVDMNYLGGIGKVKHINEDKTYQYEVDFGDRVQDFQEWQLEKVGEDKSVKPTPVLYVVTYDMEGHDPVKTFTSKKEMNAWLKEAHENRSVVWSSIKVFEVKKEYQVGTTFSLKKVA